MKWILLHKKHYRVPEDWNELTGDQLIRIMHLFHTGKPGIAFETALLNVLTACSWWRFWWIGPVALEEALYLTDFLFKGNTLIKNILPVYEGFYGPASDFQTLIVSEYIFSEQYYQQYKEQESMSDLNMLIATIYRPGKKKYDARKNPDGDIRQPYNDNLTAYFASQIAKWPMSVKLSILHWYEGCRQNLVQLFPDVYGGGSGEAARYGLFSIMRGVAEKGIHGNINQVEKMYIKVLLMELSEMIDEANRIKSSAKNTTSNG